MIEQHTTTINGTAYIFTLYDASGDFRKVEDYKPIEKTISQLEHELTEKHGTFITHSSKLILKPA